MFIGTQRVTAKFEKESSNQLRVSFITTVEGKLRKQNYSTDWENVRAEKFGNIKGFVSFNIQVYFVYLKNTGINS